MPNQLTYLYDKVEGVSLPFSLSHLINERNVLNVPSDNHFAIVSKYETFSRRAKCHQTLLTQFVQRWKREYILSIMESYKGKQSMEKPVIEVGDIVVLRNDDAKRAFWKLEKFVKLFTGADGAQGAKVEDPTAKGGKTYLNRSLQHLVPYGQRRLPARPYQRVQSARRGARSDASGEASSASNDAARNSIACNKPRRKAAIICQVHRRDAMLI